MKRTGIFLLLLTFAPLLYASTAGDVRDGNRHYKKGRYDHSLEKYREAEISSPHDPAVHFNIGDALYKTEDFEGAGAEFQRALASKDRRVRSAAYYNLGNAAFRADKAEEALEYYKQALDLDPDDRDAKYNIEYILNQKKNPQRSKDSKDTRNGKDGKDRQENGQGGRDEKQQDKEKGGQNKPGISKEDAQRILQYYNESDKNAAQKRKMMMPQLPKVEEDW